MKKETVVIDHIEEITAEALIGNVEALKKDGYRFVTVTATELDAETIDLVYTFDKQIALKHLRMAVKKGTTAKSISGVYFAAFLVENEIREQFGLGFEGLVLDFGGALLLEDSVRPTPLCRYTVVEAKRDAPAAGA
jgi:ech hydrogenase subunit D